MEYRHTQTAGVIIAVPALIALGIVAAAVIIADAPIVIPLVVAAILLVVFAVFARLTVSVDASQILAAFGWGWPRRAIPVADVVTATPVRNRWYHGWGIRWIGNGWMYNVAGFDAVELQLSSGRRFRIGTDEPDALAAAIRTRTK